jgi:hypothetical protein
MTFQAIVDGLMKDGILTSRGRRYLASINITAIVESDNAAQLVDDFA